MEKAGEYEKRIGMPEPREGLWYGLIEECDEFERVFIARHTDSLGVLPARRAHWRYEQMPEGSEGSIEEGRRFWWDDLASHSRENRVRKLDDELFGFYPLTPITPEEYALASQLAAETIAAMGLDDQVQDL